jgi:NitT/TauT family transport system permease protein
LTDALQTATRPQIKREIRVGRVVASRSFQLPVRFLLRASSILLCLALWQVASAYKLHFGLVTFRNVPAPSEVFVSAVALAQSPKLLSHLTLSIYRVLAGFIIAAAIGVLLGLIVGRWRIFRDIFLPPLELLRPIPAVAWIPLSILMFPSSEASMIYITFLGALFPILLSTIHGVESVDARLIASAQSLGAGRYAIMREVILPAALPGILTGLTIGMGTSWFCLVTAEMISGQFGIGYYTWEAYTLQNYADIVVGMVTIGVLGMTSSFAVSKLGTLVVPWYRPNRSS